LRGFFIQEFQLLDPTSTLIRPSEPRNCNPTDLWHTSAFE
jgi:hypothetical protein